MNTTIAMDTITLNGVTHLVAQTPNGPATASPYTHADQADRDVLTQMEEHFTQKGVNIATATGAPLVLRLANPTGTGVKILAAVEFSNGPYLVSGREGTTLSVQAYDIRTDRDQALAEYAAELATEGWTFKY